MEHLALLKTADAMSMDWKWLGFLVPVMGGIIAVYGVVAIRLKTGKAGRPRDERGQK